jgi:hypothetical protein
MTQVQGNNLLDVLKKKMRQTKEEMEKYKEESEDMARKLQVEIRRREEVSCPYLPRHSPRRSVLVWYGEGCGVAAGPAGKDPPPRVSCCPDLGRCRG